MVAGGIASWRTRRAADRLGPPEQFVAELASQVVTTLRDRSVDEAQRLERVDGLTAGAFDLDRTARIALGRYWKTAPDAERRSSQRCSRTMCSPATAAASTSSPTAPSASPASPRAGERCHGRHAWSKVAPTPIRLDWRLTATESGWRVLDIVVEGVSLLVTFRNEFAAVIERSGGRLAGLLDELRHRVAAERAQLSG